MQRVIVYVLHRKQSSSTEQLGMLIQKELKRAEEALWKVAQENCDSEEFKLLSSTSHVQSTKCGHT